MESIDINQKEHFVRFTTVKREVFLRLTEKKLEKNADLQDFYSTVFRNSRRIQRKAHYFYTLFQIVQAEMFFSLYRVSI